MSATVNTVLITGANRGIGLALAKHYLALGCEVIALYRNEDTSQELLALQQDNPALHPLKCDVAHDASVRAAAALCGIQYDSLDVVINNAGVLPGGETSLADVTPETMISAFDTNVAGPLRITKAFLPLLKSGSAKVLVNISSVMGSNARTSRPSSLSYRVSKAALTMLTTSAAAELTTYGITAFSVHPGWVKTDMGGANAEITTEQSVDGITALVARAALDASLSGAFLNYDGTVMPF